eukprot:6198974-Pleurochrysis_carterae.AAC.1
MRFRRARTRRDRRRRCTASSTRRRALASAGYCRLARKRPAARAAARSARPTVASSQGSRPPGRKL